MNPTNPPRTPIKDLLNLDEKPVLEELYVRYGVATDQLRRDQTALTNITNAFNQITSRDFSPGLLLRYMLNRRKAKDWAKLGSKAKKFESVKDLLSDYQLETLRSIYLEMDIPSDEFLINTDLKQAITQRFERLTRTKADGAILIAAIMAKRKRGEWVKIREVEGFEDIEQIA